MLLATSLFAFAAAPADAGFGVRQVGTLPERIEGSRNVVTLGGKAYFASQGVDPATNQSFGNELWSYDGQAFALAADIRPGGSGSFPRYLTRYGSKLYFQANDGTLWSELWSFDGQDATRLRVPGSNRSTRDAQNFTVWDDQLFFTSGPLGAGGAPRELYRYDGTNFSLMSTTIPNFASENYYVGGSDGFYYPARDDGPEFAMYRYDGNQTQLLGPGSGRRPASLGEDVLYVRGGPNFTNVLTKLTDQGFTTIADGFLSSRLLPLTEFQGDYYYLASRPNNATDLWKYDGQDFLPVHSFQENVYNTYTGFFKTDETLFLAIDGAVDGQPVGNEVWAFDGDSVTLVADLLEGPDNSFSQGFFELNGEVHFFANSTANGRQLFKIISVPEPSTLLLALGCLCTLLAKRSHR